MSEKEGQQRAEEILDDIKGLKRIDKLFRLKKERVLSVYCTAGYPRLESTIEVMIALEEAGADMIELGMPYSDPLADGPVIQESSMVALENGMSIHKLFEQLQDFRKQVYLPVVLMGYLNPVLQYGFEKFCQHAAALAIDGFIIPDMPLEEYEATYKQHVDKYGLSFIFMVTPETSAERTRKIDDLSSGFLYAVSSSSTTGKNQDMEKQLPYFLKLKEMGLNNPVLAGFGIKDKNSFDLATKYTNGAIIGTAFIKAIGNTPDIKLATALFLGDIVK